MTSNEGVERFDVIIIGAGQAGGPLASAFAGAGRKTALIEREHVGGTCVNEGCTPTKTMIASGRVAYLARRGADYGVQTGEITIDMTKVRQRKRAIVASFRGGGERRLHRSEGLVLIDGEARFVDATTVAVTLADGGMRYLASDLIVHQRRSSARRARRSTGHASVAVYNSTSIMELEVVPGTCIVLGGGYIGLEFGQMFRRFGSPGDGGSARQAPACPRGPDIADAMAAILREDGIEVLLESDAVRVEPGRRRHLPHADDAGWRAHLARVAPARRGGPHPEYRGLNLGPPGETDERGFIPVDERLETNVPGIYALGDVNGGPAFTHISTTTSASSGRTCWRAATHDRWPPGALHRLHRPQLGALA